MKKTEVLKKIESEAISKNLEFSVVGLIKHYVVRVGRTTGTLGRHCEIDEVAAVAFFNNYADQLGEGWWE